VCQIYNNWPRFVVDITQTFWRTFSGTRCICYLTTSDYFLKTLTGRSLTQTKLINDFMRVCWSKPARSCSVCDEGLFQSSVIIGIVVWLLLLTIFLIVLVVVLLTTSTTVHRFVVGGRRRPAGDRDAGRVVATPPRPPPTTIASQNVTRRFSAARSFYAEPWMNTLAENVWKDYPLETIEDT